MAREIKLTPYQERVLKEFEEKFDSMLSLVEAQTGESERVNVEVFLISALTGQLDEIMEKVQRLLIIHDHNSIPNYTDNLDVGCTICIENKNTLDILALLDNPSK